VRTTLKFDVIGTTLSSIKTQVAYRIAEFLELDDVSGIDEVADMELSVTQEDSLYPTYQATAIVRIRQ
jgi:hypothetical protein